MSPILIATPAGWFGGPGRLPRRPCSRRFSSSEGSAAQGSPGRDPGQPYRGPRGPLSGGRGVLRGNENKPLGAFSNRNSNDSRKLATLSKSI
jgi:hypothetical protein